MHVKNLTAPIYLGKAHFPTGTVSVEAVLRFAIEELGVQPLQPDWRATLAETERNPIASGRGDALPGHSIRPPTIIRPESRVGCRNGLG